MVLVLMMCGCGRLGTSCHSQWIFPRADKRCQVGFRGKFRLKSAIHPATGALACPRLLADPAHCYISVFRNNLR
jgi:hypothetical protein